MNLRLPTRPDFVSDSAQPLRLCAEEIWSFVRHKKGQRWLWWVEDATTGQVLAFVFGRRTHATFRRLLAVLTTAGWPVERWFTEACLPAAQHQVGKGALQRLERKHLTLRTRLKRLARKTICFSKK